jgi:hypothetical protein
MLAEITTDEGVTQALRQGSMNESGHPFARRCKGFSVFPSRPLGASGFSTSVEALRNSEVAAAALVLLQLEYDRTI